jgi:hypothetical protein
MKMKESMEQSVDRARAKLAEQNIFKTEGGVYIIRSLFPLNAWRPVRESWWKKKEACVIGEAPDGNLYLRVCDGTVRYWNRQTQNDEIIAPTV